MRSVHSKLHERPLLEKVVKPVTSGHETFFTTRLKLILATSFKDCFPAGFEIFDEFFFDSHVSIV